ncbi:hypothetical protein A20C1_01946 [marine actinobacterium PHSC20C1]|nr:hypothetical protein A20C1_01946 [marine actinobacterium PHSC20C1]
MTTTRETPAIDTRLLPFGNTISQRLTPALFHKPLLWLAILMGLAAAVALVGLIVDPRTITGAPLWAKPLKFALSIALYSLTLSWLIGMLKHRTKLAWWLGSISALFLAVEMVVIVGAAAIGTTSHFNVTTPLTTALWSLMGASIVVVWSAAIALALLLWRHRISDPARSFAIKAGLIIGIAGMGLAFLMTSPNAEQLSNFQGIAGAHTVGMPDGGEGLPLLGWSTVAGDLRVPHFIGMHALQLLPLSALLLELLRSRVRALQLPIARRRILVILAALYGAVTALLTAQALMGQSIVQPDAIVATIASVLFATAASAIAITVVKFRTDVTQ